MDLTQKKLSKSEWNNVEVPFPDREKNILKIIVDGFHNPDIYQNETQSLHSIMKIEDGVSGFDEYIYTEYFENVIKRMITKYPTVIGSYISPIVSKNKKLKLKKSYLMRITNVNNNIEKKKQSIYEFILLDISEKVMKHFHKYSSEYAFHLYTLINIKKANVIKTNHYCISFIDQLINLIVPKIQMSDVVNQAYQFIEKNPLLLKYENMTLYKHQKDIFRLFHYTPPDGKFVDPLTPKFQALSKEPAKLVLYTAPTGTGKTLTPLGLSSGYRVIFICAARHVGLALAKSAVCMGKRIGIAFGCETPDDIRLHYYAASEYTRNRRTGGIGKVDNTVGDKVEIMICDIKSYLVAMRYMLAFTPELDDNLPYEEAIEDIDTKLEYLTSIYDDISDSSQQDMCELKINELQEKRKYIQEKMIKYDKDCDIITYWDEPTISMDYDTHPLHELIQKVWKDNVISKVVLSCATLPLESEISPTIKSFKDKFPNGIVSTISSYDCKKSISMLNTSGKAVLPHLIYSDFDELQACIVHCNIHKSLLRYFDLQEIVKFINKIHAYDDAIPEEMHMKKYFANGIYDITMNSLKIYYLTILENVNKDRWDEIHEELYTNQVSKYSKSTDFRRFLSQDQPKKTTTGGQPLSRVKSVGITPTITKPPPINLLGLQVTTSDAHTLTDGPTIYLTNNVDNLGKFYIKNTGLPETIQKSIYSRIEQNTHIQKQLTSAENKLEFMLDKISNANTDSSSTKGGGKKNDRKLNREVDDSKQNPELRKLTQIVDELRSQIQMVNLDEKYIPNTRDHQNVWTSDYKENAYSPDISDEDVCDIMALDVDNNKKMLLLLGIGTFTNENESNPRYMEIMKRLAYDQRLYLILASSDYIYGTNYQFSHGYVGKDLLNMTQQKTIQALGRIGRSNAQQEYTVRFRDDRMLTQLFTKSKENKEADIMNQLFH